MDKLAAPTQESNTNACGCTQKLSTSTLNADLPVTGTPANSNAADSLANALGVSPLYRQQDSARWTNAYVDFLGFLTSFSGPMFTIQAEHTRRFRHQEISTLISARI